MSRRELSAATAYGGAMRAVTLVIASLLAAACSTAPVADTTTSQAATTTSTAPGGAPSETTAPAAGDGTTTTRVPPAGDPAPDFTLALGEGGEFTLSEAATPVHLVFWAEWCPVCSRELPTIDAVAPDYDGRVTFVFVAGRSSIDASRQRVGSWFDPDRILWGYDESLWTLYEVFGQPVSFLISSDGVIVDQWFGHQAETFLRDRLDALVAVG